MASNERRHRKEFGKMLNNYQKFLTRSRNPLKQGLPVYMEGGHKVVIKFQGDEGKVFEYDVDFSIMEDDKGQVGYMVSVEDTGNNKKADSKSMRLDSWLAEEEIAASYVHELKNPLFSIRGFLQIIRQSFSDDDKRKEYADIAINELDRMNNLLTEYLSRYKARNGTEVKAQTAVSVKTVIEELIAFFQHTLYLKGVSYEIEFEDSELFVLIRKEQLMQVLINIVQNSIEAMDRGDHLSLKAFREDGWVVIEIKDDGVGIKRTELNKIFDPFFSTKENGTGLGLYITKRIVENNGGTISVDSIEGEGTTIYLKFPRADTEE